MKRAITLALSLAFGWLGSPAFADTLKLQCTPAADCTNGSTTLVDTNSTPQFNLISTASGELMGTAFLGVLTPDGPSTFTVQVGATTITAEETATLVFNNELGTVLNEGPGMTDFHFSSFGDASSQVGVNPGSYTAYEYNLGAFDSPGNGATGLPGSLMVGALPGGSVIVAWLEDAQGHVLEQTPLSESAAITVGSGSSVPESSSLFGSALFAMGLGVFGLAGRKRSAASIQM